MSLCLRTQNARAECAAGLRSGKGVPVRASPQDKLGPPPQRGSFGSIPTVLPADSIQADYGSGGRRQRATQPCSA